jgi:putative transposase
VKYRRKVFDFPGIIDKMKQVVQDIAPGFGVMVINQETDLDHIHILFRTKPTTELTKFVNSLKGVSARLLFKEFPFIKSKLWKGSLWSPSYFLATSGQVTLDQLKVYVESQGNKPKKART